MTAAAGFALFATAIGDCAVAWRTRGLSGGGLPDASAACLRSRLARRLGGVRETEPGGPVIAAMAAMTRLLDGDHCDLLDVVIDDANLDPFDRRGYAAARTIAPGRVVTYAALAESVGGLELGARRRPGPGAQSLSDRRACRRVVAAAGGLGGLSAPGGSATKRRLLTIANARLDGPAKLFDAAESATQRARSA